MSTPFDSHLRQTSGLYGLDKPASQASVAYLRDLMLEKADRYAPVFDEAVSRIDAWLCNRTQVEVSTNIDRLKGEGYTGNWKK